MLVFVLKLKNKILVAAFIHSSCIVNQKCFLLKISKKFFCFFRTRTKKYFSDSQSIFDTKSKAVHSNEALCFVCFIHLKNQKRKTFVSFELARKIFSDSALNFRYKSNTSHFHNTCFWLIKFIAIRCDF